MQIQTLYFVRVKQIVFTVVLLCLAPLSTAQTIKIATLAPEGSSWMNDMRAGAAEIKQRTQGRVEFKFYGGGVQGNDNQVLRKMRIGQLHGGAFTSNAVSVFQKNAQLYALPMLFANSEEARYVRAIMDQSQRAALEDAGYVNFGFAGGGFAFIMSKRPISKPSDTKGLKVWVPDNDPMAFGAIKAMGVSPVILPLTDVLTGLQTELIDTIMAPPAAAIVLQWNTAVNYITEQPLAYIFAILIIEKKAFERLQADDQIIVREVMEQVYLKFDQRGDAENAAAHVALLEDGIQSVSLDAKQLDVWKAAVRDSNHKLAAEGIIDLPLLIKAECYVNAFRSGSQEPDC
ncbi:MAG: TRAP transporter substrate-binding protein DctP [Xanthomonadales bacterium]|nr:TRAP transporter substrate-binding protein DctP [Xanthomonadales bacterium]